MCTNAVTCIAQAHTQGSGGAKGAGPLFQSCQLVICENSILSDKK